MFNDLSLSFSPSLNIYNMSYCINCIFTRGKGFEGRLVSIARSLAYFRHDSRGKCSANDLHAQIIFRYIEIINLISLTTEI